MKRAKIEITNHARTRLKERMPQVKSCEYQQLVIAARYKGDTLNYLWDNKPRIAKYIVSHFKFNHSTELRIYNHYVFIFCGNKGHCRTLKTVVDLPEKIF